MARMAALLAHLVQWAFLLAYLVGKQARRESKVSQCGWFIKSMGFIMRRYRYQLFKLEFGFNVSENCVITTKTQVKLAVKTLKQKQQTWAAESTFPQWNIIETRFY